MIRFLLRHCLDVDGNKNIQNRFVITDGFTMNDDNSVKSNTINVSDKLENSVNTDIIPEVPQEIIYPNELNNFLREQLRFYVQKNGLLQQNLNDLEVQYNRSKENLDKLIEKLNNYEKLGDKTKFTSSSQVATSKIIELSKKLREKNSEMESLKTKCSKMEKYAFDLKRQFENEYPTYVKEPISQGSPNIVSAEEELKKLNEKLTIVSNKLAESNNFILQLKNEIKLAKKIVQQETGDNFENLQSLNNSNGWRGRAQTILDLQQKNAELKEKLKTAQANNPVEVIPAAPSKSDIQLIALTKEYDELKVKYEELKKKHDILKARHKVIDIDYTLLKSKSGMLKDQATRDQQVITTLLGQLNTSKEVKNDIVSQKERSITKLQTEKKLLLQEIDEYKSVIKKLQDKQKEDDKICSKSVDNIKEKSNIASEVIGDAKFLEFIEQSNQKLKFERESHAKTQNLLRIEKQKLVKTEAALARTELEVTTRSTYSSSSTLRALDPSLKDQLELAEEQIKALQTRLEIEQMERRNDIQQFGQILKTYENKITTS